MRTYKKFFDRMITYDNVRNCVLLAAKGKRSRRDVRKCLENLDENVFDIIQSLTDDTWRPPKHKTVRINESTIKKEREITKPHWRQEQIIHHVLMSQFRQVVLNRINENIYGSIPKLGPHKAAKTMKGWVDSYNGKKLYVAELDIRKFYDNVDHEILKELLKRSIKDERYLRILFRIIDAYKTNTEENCDERPRGLPLGNYTSPWLANFYLLKMDEFILQEQKPDHYLRYMDNLFVFGRNKRKLHTLVRDLSDWLWEKRRLWLKDTWQVFKFEDSDDPSHGRAINALGFVIHRNRVTLRKTILHGIIKTARRINKRGTIRECDAASFIARCGYGESCDIHGYMQKHVKPLVSPKSCKKVISEKAKRRRKKAAAAIVAGETPPVHVKPCPTRKKKAKADPPVEKKKKTPAQLTLELLLPTYSER